MIWRSLPRPANNQTPVARPEARGELADYRRAIEAWKNALQRSPDPFSVKLLLDILLQRDVLEQRRRNGELTRADLLNLDRRDRQFQKLVERFNQKAKATTKRRIATQLNRVRDVHQPPADAWWWHPEITVNVWDRLDGFWKFLTIVFLAIAASLLSDIFSRFLGGSSSPGFTGFLAIAAHSLLAAIGGSTFIPQVRMRIENQLKGWPIARDLWEETQCAIALTILLIFLAFRASLPTIANIYHNIGVADYRQGQLSSAQIQYKRAIALDPDFAEAHYNLAVIYEDLQDFNKARQEYKLALEAGLAAASNQLGRLEILDENYTSAVYLLNQGLLLHGENPLAEGGRLLEHKLLKNLGWARWQQERYSEARDHLESAIAIDKEYFTQQYAAPYCLLGFVLKELEQEAEALKNLRTCTSPESIQTNPEEDEWIYLARQILQSAQN